MLDKKWIRTTGYVVLALSVLIWVMIAVIPFLDLSKARKAGTVTALIIAGEITFYLGIFMLGKTLYNALKSKIMFWKAKKGPSETSGSTDATTLSS